jgi:hypothetical protein
VYVCMESYFKVIGWYDYGGWQDAGWASMLETQARHWCSWSPKASKLETPKEPIVQVKSESCLL